MNCTCGESLLLALGDGFVITPTQDKKWMRRRGDVVVCPACSARYDLDRLKDLAQRTSV